MGFNSGFKGLIIALTGLQSYNTTIFNLDTARNANSHTGHLDPKQKTTEPMRQEIKWVSDSVGTPVDKKLPQAGIKPRYLIITLTGLQSHNFI